jgi:hypothetical protein
MFRYPSQESIHRSRLAAPHQFPPAFASISSLAGDDTAVDRLDGAQDTIDANVFPQLDLSKYSTLTNEATTVDFPPSSGETYATVQQRQI